MIAPLWKVGPLLFAKFTPSEQECISAKIREIKDKGLRGKPASQAQTIAVAIKTCAPGKAIGRSARGFQALGAPLRHAFPAEQQPNGNWTIRGIPIFSVTFDDRDEDAFEFSEKWLDESIAMHQARESGGHLYPAHVEHHVPGRPDIKREQAGFFTHARKGTWRDPATGGELPTLFVDLVEVPDAVFQRIRDLRLPYRSVEILNPEVADVDSLALMSSEVPYFRYPVTAVHVAQVGQRPANAVGSAVASRIALAACTPQGGRRFLFAYSGGTMAEPKTKTYQEGEASAPPASPPPAPAEGGDAGMAGMADVKSICEQIAAGQQEMLELLRGLLAGGATEENPEVVAQPSTEGAPAPAAAAAAKENAKLFAQVQGLQGRLSGIEQERDLDRRIAGWKDRRLAFDEGAIRKAAKTFAAKGAMRDYLDELERHLPQAPETPSVTTTVAAAAPKSDHPVMKQFAAMGFPDWLMERAHAHLHAWETTPMLQDTADGSPETYVRAQLSADLRSYYARGSREQRDEIDRLRRRFLTAASAGANGRA